MTDSEASEHTMNDLAATIKTWGGELGFQQIGITDCDLSEGEQRLNQWLEKSHHGEMDYMARHGTKRSRPAELLAGTIRVISVRMDYMQSDACKPAEVLNDSSLAYISRYALGRDYHKLMRHRLQQLANKVESKAGKFGYRAFVDSAPVLEKALAEKAGLGWIGKHSNLLNSKAGSWFFLGEIYTNLPLPTDNQPQKNHCGTCTACIDICPTKAIVGPQQVDARRCISYLTIELQSAIPEEFRPMIGNRIYGCDDCQLVCPWNRFSQLTKEDDFSVRHQLDSTSLITLFNWTETQFLERMQGSAIRRIGHECWLRNIAVALGNAETSAEVITALKQKLDHPSEMLREHVYWALNQHIEMG